jgi:hypothetical protein
MAEPSGERPFCDFLGFGIAVTGTGNWARLGSPEGSWFSIIWPSDINALNLVHKISSTISTARSVAPEFSLNKAFMPL